MADLRQILSQGRKRIGLLLGAGAPTAIRVNADNEIVDEGEPLIRDVDGLTDAVVSSLCAADRVVIEKIQLEITRDGDPINIETVLTKVRRLSQAIGRSEVHSLDGSGYDALGGRICELVGSNVQVNLPESPNPFTELVAWVAGTQREHAVEIFTPNYDLLIEEAFERVRIPYFDGFVGAHRPFFDPTSVSSDRLPARWSRLWKLHGSLGWAVSDKTVVRSGRRETTELIYPEHLKYDQATKLPYSALFEHLMQFLSQPDTLLVCSGFSFQDSHICAVLEEALTVNDHAAVLAFQFRTLEEEAAATRIALLRPNMSVYSPDGAIIGGIPGSWRLGQPLHQDWGDIRRTFWGQASPDQPGRFLLGDFAKLARFLALTQARELTSIDSVESEQSAENASRQDS